MCARLVVGALDVRARRRLRLRRLARAWRRRRRLCGLSGGVARGCVGGVIAAAGSAGRRVGQERAAKKEAIALEERLKREKSLGETERSGFLEKEIVDLLKRRAPGKTC